jgi:pimeloyl-ACP methyl ester carboxylesterase
VATYVFVHGACASGWVFHLVADELRGCGHEVLAVDLPCDRDEAGFATYADVVVGALDALAGRDEVVGSLEGRDEVVVVAHSLGAYTAGLVCARRPVALCVLVAALPPAPGESVAELFAAAEAYADPDATPLPTVDPERSLAEFLTDVPRGLALEALARDRDQSATPVREPWPLDTWPPVLTRFVLGRRDRVLPAAWLRRAVPERLGVVPDELDSGHAPHLSHPVELAALLERYREEACASAG